MFVPSFCASWSGRMMCPSTTKGLRKLDGFKQVLICGFFMQVTCKEGEKGSYVTRHCQGQPGVKSGSAVIRPNCLWLGNCWTGCYIASVFLTHDRNSTGLFNDFVYRELLYSHCYCNQTFSVSSKIIVIFQWLIFFRLLAHASAH